MQRVPTKNNVNRKIRKNFGKNSFQKLLMLCLANNIYIFEIEIR